MSISTGIEIFKIIVTQRLAENPSVALTNVASGTTTLITEVTV